MHSHGNDASAETLVEDVVVPKERSEWVGISGVNRLPKNSVTEKMC